VELVAREGNILSVKGLDAIDGTPLLDIKPYIPSIDEKTNGQVGWLKDRFKGEGRGRKGG
jgi:formylmethanofuran dehydrogenase subunit E